MGAVLGALGGLLGGAASAYGAKQQQDFEAAQAQKQMDFQERMSSTIYQRGTADMRAAGLNPILAAGNVSTPGAGGAMAEGQNVGGAFASGAEGGASSALAVMNAIKDMSVKDASIHNANMQASAASAKAALDSTRATNEATGVDNVSYEVLNKEQQLRNARAQNEAIRASVDNMRATSALTQASTGEAAYRSAHPAQAIFGPPLISSAAGIAKAATAF